jgi:DNA-binding GntR family transcriptional regulator
VEPKPLIDNIINNPIDTRAILADHPGMHPGTSLRAEPEAVDASAAAALIVQALEEDIVFGRVNARERLIESDLMERFDAKRHVVRQALAELERIGLAERLPGRSVTVRDLQPAEVEQIYAMRELLETAAARWMRLPAPPELVDELSQIQRAHDAAGARRDLRSMFRINIKFHEVLFSRCGNEYLTEQIELFGKKAHAVRSFSITRAENIKSAGLEHWEIIRALRDGDRKGLVAVCREHIAVSKNAYIEAYKARFPSHPHAL